MLVKTQGIYLPAQMVTSGWGVPPLCVRDGRPAVARRRITFVSRTPAWVYLTLLVGWLVTLILLLMLQKRVKAPGWPVCADCMSQRRQRLTVMWLLLVGGPVLAVVLAGVLGSSPGNDGSVASVLLVGCLGAPIGAAVVGSTGSWSEMFKAAVDPTGASVNFREPAPAFVRSLPGMSTPAPAPAPAYGSGPPF